MKIFQKSQGSASYGIGAVGAVGVPSSENVCYKKKKSPIFVDPRPVPFPYGTRRVWRVEPQEAIVFLRFGIMGFASGLPFAVMLFTLSFWLYECGISCAVVGWLAWSSLPYALKVPLAILMDGCALPSFLRKLGKFRGWALLTQGQMAGLFLLLAVCDASSSLVLLASVCLWIHLCAALQDIALESYRAERTPRCQQGTSALANSVGFRLGLWAGTYVPLQVSHWASWRWAFGCIFLFYVGIMINSWFSPDSLAEGGGRLVQNPRHRWEYVLTYAFRKFCWSRECAGVALIILFYKFADVFCRSMTAPFLLEMGYTKDLMADVDKFLGLGFSLMGSAFAGFAIQRWGIRGSFLVWSILQAVVCGVWIPHGWIGYSVPYFTVTTLASQFSAGVGGTVLLAYFSSLCRPPATSLKYAFLSSIGALGRILATFGAGHAVGCMSWWAFFLLGCVLCVATFFLLLVTVPTEEKGQAPP